eukprot:jgi/Chrzof1/7506/Cz02g26090.t1
MKISIQVDLDQSEVPLATELLNTLRLLTEHVKGSTNPSFNVNVTEAASQPQLAPVPVASAREQLHSLLSSLAAGSSVDQVADNISSILTTDKSGLSPDQLSEQFLEAFNIVAFQHAHVLQNVSVAPHMYILPKLPEPFKTKIRDKLIQKVLAHLTRKRSVEIGREVFLLQAEAFAVLVEIDFVGIDGALQTIDKLLKKPDNRSAAITMLGKTVEKCSDKLGACNITHLSSLAATVGQITEPQFLYDIDYIKKHLAVFVPLPQQHPASAAALPSIPIPQPVPTAFQHIPQSQAAVHTMQQVASQPMGAGPHIPIATPVGDGVVALKAVQAKAIAEAAALASAPCSRSHQLTAVGQWDGHGGAIFAMAYDAVHDNLICGGRDMSVMVWSKQGQVVHNIDASGMYVAAMDVDPRHNLLLMSGVSPEPNAAIQPRISIYDTNQSWANRANVLRDSTEVIACLRCLSDGFVSGETHKDAAGADQQQLCYYDMGRALSGGASNSQPVHIYTEHSKLVACVAPVLGNPNQFVSGSGDRTIRMWDLRQQTSVGVLGMPSMNYNIEAHSDMVTCLDAVDHMLLSGSVDATMCAWDLRMVSQSPTGCGPLHQFNVDGYGILKVALSGSPVPRVAAVATFQSLYLVDLNQTDVQAAGSFNRRATPSVTRAALFADGSSSKQYHDIKWAAGQPVLFAAAENACIDLLQMQ